MTAKEVIGGIALFMVTVGGAYVVLRAVVAAVGWAYRQVFGDERDSEVIDGNFELDYDRPNPDEEVMRKRGEKG